MAGGETLDDSDEQSTLRLVNWRPGHRIGPYRILEKLGEGGMGVVYLAEQTEPIRRKVALKIVKLGLDLDQITARFESERQALAMMDHACIAEIFEAGATAEGLPYFVMEYVSGKSITRHCDEHKLSLRERLELFIQVCEAVQHAHHKAIIHRDLKPSNILVVVRDGKAIPKIIDFGLAKTLAQPLTDKTLHTGIGQLLGTPKYMSPEQADLTNQNIDTRSDIYSLGGILYELLIGVSPIEAKGASFPEMLRIIRDQEPTRPSRKLRTMGEVAEQVARNRGTAPATLQRRLGGDLDWITVKALEKDRNRRYSSAGEMAEDVRRYLSERPIMARPPSLGYTARKFARRHRLAVVTSAFALGLTVVFAVLMALQAQRIVAERDRANREAETARQVAEFLTDLFRLSDPTVAQGRQPSARELLDRGAEKIGAGLAAQPAVQARLQKIMAEAYENLGLYGEADPLYQAALEGQRRLLGEEHPETLQTSGDLFTLRWLQGRLEEAEEGFVKTLEAKRRLLGDTDPSTLGSINSLANLFLIRGRYGEAEELYHQAYQTRARVQGQDHPDTIGAGNNLALVFAAQGRMDEAGRLYEATLEARRRIQGENHPDTIGAAFNLAEHYSTLNRFEQAEPLHLGVLERRRKVQGDRHPDTLTSFNALGDLYRRTRRFDQAERYLRAAAEGRKEVLGEGHREHVHTLFNLGKLRESQGRYSEAEVFLRQAADGWTALFGALHPYVRKTKDGLARVFYYQKRYREAEVIFREILEQQRQSGEEFVETLVNLACVNALQSQRREALDCLREAVEAGFSDPAALADPDLASLQDDTEFRALLTTLQARAGSAE
jgi:eukaryotic-like serine/threonine-protein kinase